MFGQKLVTFFIEFFFLPMLGYHIYGLGTACFSLVNKVWASKTGGPLDQKIDTRLVSLRKSRVNKNPNESFLFFDQKKILSILLFFYTYLKILKPKIGCSQLLTPFVSNSNYTYMQERTLQFKRAQNMLDKITQKEREHKTLLHNYHTI